MKKILLAVIASVTFSLGAVAQEQKENQGDRKRLDPKEMAQRRTDNMVKKYGLNEEQAKQLLELNIQHAGKMPPRQGMRFGRRPEGAAPAASEEAAPPRPEDAASDTTQKARPQRMERRGGRGEMPEEMRKEMESYNNALKAILTEEQYKAYKEDMQKRGPRGPRQQKQD